MEKSMFTIKSISDEGVYYLVSNWRKNNALWIKENKIRPNMLFKTIAGAKKSLSSLLKTMPEYIEDKFFIVEIKEDKINIVESYNTIK